jgi:hypothetical protein
VGGSKKQVKKVNMVVVLSIQESLNWLKLSSGKGIRKKKVITKLGYSTHIHGSATRNSL